MVRFSLGNGLACVLAAAVTMLSAVAPAAESSADHPPAPVAPTPAPGQVGLLFTSPEGTVQVIRSLSGLPVTRDASLSTTQSQALAVVKALVAGPTQAEQAELAAYSFLPDGTTLGKVEFTGPNGVLIGLDLPSDFLNSPDYNENFVHEVSEHFIESLLDLGVRSFTIEAKEPTSGEYRGLRDFLPQPDLAAAKAEAEKTSQQSDTSTTQASALSSVAPRDLPTENGFISGALSGKSVVLNGSHGWYDNTTTPLGWHVQRTRTWELLEDYNSAMFMNHYVMPLLQNAGARPRPVREPDSQTNMVVIDNAMAAPAYTETGGGWFNSSLNGYVHKTQFTGVKDNPFGNASATRLVPGSTGVATAWATYTPTIPATGFYNVYISYAAGSDRTSNAHWQVHHSGGVTDFRIDQKKGGATWVLLGNFYFEAGAPATEAKVVALNDSGDTAYLNVDAVRFGGGMGNVARRNSGISGRPRWQEEACNYLQYTGMLASSLMSSDPTGSNTDEQLGWGNRPQYANWEQTRDGLGNNLIYVGWHTNASGWKCSGGVETSGAGRGTTTYRDVDADATANTESLTSLVHAALIKSIRTGYLSTWQDRGIVASNGYGECSQGNLGGVAGFFFEGLFHDNAADADCYRDPKWRYAAARGIVQGIISYYGGTVFPPEPVTNFRVKNIGNNQVQLNWTAGPVRSGSDANGSAATGYRIYSSDNGFGFDNGVDTPNATPQYTMTLTPGTTKFFRISAVNSAGISVPSVVLAARVPLNGAATFTIVNGYLRNDKYLGPTISSSGIGGCTAPTNAYRTFDPRKSQSFDYVVQHALAIAAKGDYGIDSCTREAVKLSSVNLQDYAVVDWIGGQEAEADTTDKVDDTCLFPAERNALAAYLENGGRLFISGSELAWDFGRSGVAADKTTFLNNYLKTSYVSDSSNVYTASGSAGIFSGLGSVGYDNGTGSTYQVRFPDVINPVGGATTCMTYSSGGGAAIQYAGTFGSGSKTAKVVMMGFGFETITSPSTRNAVMSRVIDYFIPAGVENWKQF